jgi:hypothetical protein
MKKYALISVLLTSSLAIADVDIQNSTECESTGGSETVDESQFIERMRVAIEQANYMVSSKTQYSDEELEEIHQKLAELSRPDPNLIQFRETFKKTISYEEFLQILQKPKPK